MPAIFTTKTDGNYLLSTTDALAKVTTYGYNEDTGELDWVQYPEDTAATRTEYDYDTMYRMAMAECTTDTGLNQSVEYVQDTGQGTVLCLTTAGRIPGNTADSWHP